MDKNITVSTSNSQVNGTTYYGNTTNITIAAGVNSLKITNRDGSILPDGYMFVSGTLNLNMRSSVASAYFGYGNSNTSGSYTTPFISKGGTVNIDGNGDYSALNYVNFQNTTVNNGTINITGITMRSTTSGSVINGVGTLNLTNVYLNGNNDNYNSTAIGSITGGQTINMTNSSLAVRNSLKDVTINMIGQGNYLALNAGNRVESVRIKGFGAGNIIDVGNGVGQDAYSYNVDTGYLTITSNGTSFTVNIGKGYDPSKFAVVNTSYGDGMTGITYTDPAPVVYVPGDLYKPQTTAQNFVIDSINPWVNGTTLYGQTTTITVANGSTTGSILNENYPDEANGSLFIDGTLNIDMNYAVSSINFGGGVSGYSNGLTGNGGNVIGTTSNYTLPIVNQTGVVNITGSGAYNTANFISFKNTVANNGIINVNNISLMSSDDNSTISGTGIINLNNVRLNGNDDNYNYPMIGGISGGQTVNMINSDLSVASGLRDVTINMIGGGNYLALRPNNDLISVYIHGFGTDDIIDLANGAGVDQWLYDPSNGDLTITSNGASRTINIGTGYDITKFHVAYTKYADGRQMMGIAYDGEVDACFLPGTLINTPAGDIAVENLQVGDYVNTYNHNMIGTQKITWIGKGQGYARKHSGMINDQSNYPIRILKDAISSNVPYKDMNITLEHCLFFDGKLIPARMLVNGRSIFYDQSQQSYDFYHIETESHSIIMADGMLTESYLNTDNHQSFYQSQQSSKFNYQKLQEDTVSPVVPLCVDQAFVEPIYRAIEKSAIERKLPDLRPSFQTVPYHDLCLMTVAGQRIEVSSSVNSQLMFVVPPNTGKVFLVSRSNRPVDVMGSFINDRRNLGVLIGEIILCDTNGLKPVHVHLTKSNLIGWNDMENSDYRWTQGKAELPLNDKISENTPYVLKVSVHNTVPYFDYTKH